ncbi:MAG: N-6 DNA methylase, partial [Candidatus Riflebacteria bacterium]|nr:N-6 DNA methylase [Candidatus Riflebacteria bacterium]
MRFLVRWFRESCGREPAIMPWLGAVSDAEYPMIERDGELIPDLESRGRARKRSAGQFYTPSDLVRSLFCETRLFDSFNNCGSDWRGLDPACGDGVFLIEAARELKSRGCKNPLDLLVGCDLDADALLVAMVRLLRAFPDGGMPRLERRDFLLSPPSGCFHAVFGNPPYRVNLSMDVRAELDKRYSTAEGEKDLYTFFLEGATECLAPGGSLLMLTSHTYLVNKQCGLIREYLFGRRRACNLFLLPAGFFRAAPGVVPVVLHLENMKPAPDALIHVHAEYATEAGWGTVRSVSQREFLETTGLRRALRDERQNDVFRRMEAISRPLGEIAKVGVGIQESTQREVGAISRFVGDSADIPNAVPVLRGREVQPFGIAWEGKYLSYGPHLTYCGNPDIFRGEKILYQNLRHETLERRLVATLDKSGFFPKNSLSYVCRPCPPFSLLYILGLLSSPIVNSWFRDHYFSFHVTVTQVRSIPVPEADAVRRGVVEDLVTALLKRSNDSKPAASFDEDKDLMRKLSIAVLACYNME